MKKELITIEKKLFEHLFKDWLDNYKVVSTEQWRDLPIYERDILIEALWKDFYENWLLGKVEFRYIKEPKIRKKKSKKHN